MAKIYNEIIIDMNPESHSYMEVLHEDSFEYEGDMCLAQGTPLLGPLGWEDQGATDYTSEWIYVDGKYYRLGTDKSNNPAYNEISENMQKVILEQGDIVFEGIELAGDSDGDGVADESDAFPNDPTKTKEGEGTEWGAQNITKDMFVNPDGTPKDVQSIYTTLDKILTGTSGQELVDYINDILPKFTGVPAEEREFAKEGYEADIYGLQPKVGGAITPSTGGGMRASIGAKAGIKKGFEAAGTAYEEDIYGLEKGVAGAYETDIVGAIGRMPEGAFAEAGTTAETKPWESFMAREGGRVPSKSETFLDFLTQLPDAGGM